MEEGKIWRLLVRYVADEQSIDGVFDVLKLKEGLLESAGVVSVS